MSSVARLADKRAAAYLVAQPGSPAKVRAIAAGHGFYGIANAFPTAVETAVD